MKNFILILVFGVLLASFKYENTLVDEVLVEVSKSDSTHGIWKISDPTHFGSGGSDSIKTVILMIPSTFVYDGTFVTARFIFISKVYEKFPWKSEDEIYKMKSKWSGDTLKYMTPFNDWKMMGVFKGGTFYTYYQDQDSLHTYTFKKMNADDLSDYDKPLTNKRSPFRFRVKPY